MSTQAFRDTFVGATAGALAGRVSTSGHTWAQTTANNQNGTVSIDAIPSASAATAAGTAIASDWTPPSADYGFGALVDYLGGAFQCGPAVRVGVSAGNILGYFFQADSYFSKWNLFKGGADGTFNVVASADHTFSAPESHFLYIHAASDGAGGVNVTCYVDGTPVVTYHDLSSNSPAPITAAGQVGIRAFSSYPSTADGMHVLQCQTDAQVSTLSGPSSGAAGTASSNFTVALEVPSLLGTTAALSDGGAGGTFTPTSLSIAGATASAAGATSATFTYTPAAGTMGPVSLSATTSSPSTTDGSSPATYSVAGTYTFSGPSAGPVGVASGNFTLTPSGTVSSDTVSLSDGGAGGTFTPTSLSWTNSSAAKTFTYTPATAGAKTITPTSGHGYAASPTTITYTASNTATYTLAAPGSTSGPVGSASGSYTLTPSGSVTDTVSLSDGSAGGTFTPTSLSWSASSAAKTFTYTPGSAGAKTLTATSGASYAVSGSPATYTAVAVATQYAWSGANSGSPGLASGNITLTPSGWVTSDTVTLSDGGAGGAFTPASLSFSGGTAAHSFTYTPASNASGTLTLSGASAGSLAQSPASWSYAIAQSVAYLTSAAGLPAGQAGSATVVAKVNTGSVRSTISGASVGTIIETDEPGHYEAIVTVPASSVSAGQALSVAWTAAGVTVVDSSPALANRQNLDGSGNALVSLTQPLAAARAVNGVADTALTLNDALHGAVAGAAGQESWTTTAGTIKTPGGTTYRTFVVTTTSTSGSRT